MGDIKFMVSSEGMTFCVGMSELLFVGWDELDKMRKVALAHEAEKEIKPIGRIEDWRGVMGSAANEEGAG